jgi:hypothetical protein
MPGRVLAVEPAVWVVPQLTVKRAAALRAFVACSSARKIHVRRVTRAPIPSRDRKKPLLPGGGFPHVCGPNSLANVRSALGSSTWGGSPWAHRDSATALRAASRSSMASSVVTVMHLNLRSRNARG